MHIQLLPNVDDNSITIQPSQITQNMVIEPTSSSGGTTDYTQLRNLPTLNGKTIIGNIVEQDPTVQSIPVEDIIRILS